MNTPRCVSDAIKRRLLAETDPKVARQCMKEALANCERAKQASLLAAMAIVRAVESKPSKRIKKKR